MASCLAWRQSGQTSSTEVFTLASIAVFGVLAMGTAVAQAQPGNACPPSSPNAGGSPPCGHPANGNGNGKGVEAPEGNCARADLVVLQDAKIICVFLGENAQFATKEEDCPDVLLATGELLEGVIGVCVFLPPATEPEGAL